MINLKELIVKYPDSLESSNKLRAYIIDLYPDEKKYFATILATLLDYGIIEKIQDKDNIDNIFIDTICMKMENDYGYVKSYTRECVAIWISVYKNKNVVDTISPKIRNNNGLKSTFVLETNTLNTDKNQIQEIILFGQYPQDKIGSKGPIKWIVLKREEKKALLLSEFILEQKRFDKISNNYKNSEIRQWLNGDFFASSFSENEKKQIFCVKVDNSVNSTGYEVNKCACENSDEKIFLLSYKELIGFLPQKQDRQSICTEFAKTSGVLTYKNNNGDWWLRSPNNNDEWKVRTVSYDGGTYLTPTNNNFTGIRPALWINLEYLDKK